MRKETKVDHGGKQPLSHTNTLAWKQKSHTPIQINLCYSDRTWTFRAKNTGKQFRLLAQHQVLSGVKQISDPTLMQSNL